MKQFVASLFNGNYFNASEPAIPAFINALTNLSDACLALWKIHPYTEYAYRFTVHNRFIFMFGTLLCTLMQNVSCKINVIK